jgi:hypothetical protein
MDMINSTRRIESAVWVTFLGGKPLFTRVKYQAHNIGPIAFKTLREWWFSCHHLFQATNCYPARQQFGNLQHKTFPIYFGLSLGLSSALTAAWAWTHPDVASYITSPRVGDVAQLYTLGSVALSMAANLFVIGPMTSRQVSARVVWSDEANI